MTPATLPAPHGRRQADGTIGMLADAPAWAHFSQKVEFYDVPAAARTQHRCRPNVSPFTSDVDGGGFESVRKLVNACVGEPLRLDGSRPRLSPLTKGQYPAGQRLAEQRQPFHSSSSGSLSSGMESSGRTSPFPIWGKNVPEGDDSLSRYSVPCMKLVRTTAESALSSRR